MSAAALEDVRIASPCKASWADMAGDDRVRFCSDCNRNVYNLSAMTREDATALIATTEGRLCARFFRRADGTILTADCPEGHQARRRDLVGLGLRAGVFGAAAAAALVIPGPASDAASDLGTAPQGAPSIVADAPDMVVPPQPERIGRLAVDPEGARGLQLGLVALSLKRALADSGALDEVLGEVVPASPPRTVAMIGPARPNRHSLR